MQLLDIPTDVLRNHIFVYPYLDKLTLSICRFVCRKLRQYIKAQRFWIEDAAGKGYLNVVKWARGFSPNGEATGHKYHWNELTCSFAAEGGHLEVLQWVISNGCKWNEFTCANAAGGGYLEVLQWARTNGCPWDEYTCSDAALGGHLEVLQWARTNGCSWNAQTCSNAAYNGYLEILKWAFINGCPWDIFNCRELALESNHIHIVEWIWKQYE